MLVSELMTRDVVTITSEMSIRDAIRRLDEHGITAMPVVDARRNLIGMVSEADLLRDVVVDDPRAGARPRRPWVKPPEDSVLDVMSMHVTSVGEHADAADVSRLLLETGFKSIPVVRDEQVVGIVSRRDLIHALATTDAHITGRIEALLREVELDGITVEVQDGDVVLSGLGTAHDAKVAETLARTVAGVGAVRVVSAPVRSRSHSRLVPD